MRKLSRFLLVIFVASLVGIAAELFLVGHAHGWRQTLPVGLVTTSLVSVAWQAWYPGRFANWAFVVALTLMELGGVVGSIFHYRANSATWSGVAHAPVGRELVRRSVFGPAPILAPCSLALIALVGLAYIVARSVESRVNCRDPVA